MEETDKTLKKLKATVSMVCPIVVKTLETIETERGETYIPAIVSQGIIKEVHNPEPEPEIKKEADKPVLEPEIKEQVETDDKTTLFTHDTIEAVLRKKQAVNRGQISNVAKKLRAQQSEEGIELGE